MKTIIDSSLKLFLGGVLIMVFGFVGVNNFEAAEENNYSFSHSIVVEENGLQFNYQTDKENVAEVLSDLDIYLNEKDILMPDLETSLTTGTKIIIERAQEVTIEVDEEIINTFTTALNIRDVLKEMNISLAETDKVLPNSNELINSGLVIKVIRVKQETISEIVSVSPPVVTREDNSLSYGQTELIDSGQNGSKEQIFTIIYENGEVVSRELVSEEIISEPQPKIIAKGTKIEIGEIQTGQATWYARGLINPQALTAASNNFPRGTYLRVTNLSNGKNVIVKVNDTGAFGPPRVIDLSSGAFKKLAPLFEGVIQVEVEEII